MLLPHLISRGSTRGAVVVSCAAPRWPLTEFYLREKATDLSKVLSVQRPSPTPTGLSP